jgi:CRISPR type I-E-associated protein CasA/Cse1
MVKYDLLTEPWIPVIDKEDHMYELGITNLIEQAPKLLRLNESSPFMEFGIYRMLIALIMDVYSLQSFGDVENLLQTGQFDKKIFEEYMHQYGSHFDLFNPETPFYQGPMRAELENKEKPISNLIQHIPSGTNVIHFTHVFENNFAISPKIAAKALCALPPFMTMGGSGFSPSINGAPPIYTLILGDSLFETLVLNCLTESLSVPLNNWKSPPFWKFANFTPKMEVNAGGVLLGLTWQPRYVHLIPRTGDICMYSGESSPILVHQMYFEPGMKPVGSWIDPHAAYQKTSKGLSIYRQREGHVIWRDYGGLFLSHEIGGDFTGAIPKGVRIQRQKPAIISHFEHLKIDRYIDANKIIKIQVYSIRTDMKAKIFEWQKDLLSLPRGILELPGAEIIIQNAIEKAETIEFLMRTAIKKLYPRDGKSNKKAFEKIQDQACSQYWNNLRPIFEKDFIPQVLTAVGHRDPEVKLLNNWLNKIKQEARRIVDNTMRFMDTDADMLKRQVLAMSFFNINVSQVTF